MAAARNNRRRYKRRGRFGFLYKLLTIAAVTAAFLMGATVFFRVQTVRVAGNERYTEEQIVEISEVEQGDNLFGLNKYEVARRIRKGLPYVDTVSIRRVLPETLLITVGECSAAAKVTSQQGKWLINCSGKLLERAVRPEGVIDVKGVEALQPEAGSPILVREEQQERCDQLISLLRAIEEQQMLRRVTEINMRSAARILMELDGRFTVRLPMGGDYSYLLRAMDKAVQSLDDYEKGTLDLTVKDYTVVFSPA